MEFADDFLSGTLFEEIGLTPAQSETNLVPMTVLAGNGRVKEEPSEDFHNSVDLSDTSDFWSQSSNGKHIISFKSRQIEGRSTSHWQKIKTNSQNFLGVF